MRLKRALLVSAVLTACAGTALPAQAVSVPAGSIGIALLDAPTSARADPRAHIYIVDQLTPGSVITRHVRVTNSTPTTAHISLYAAAGSISDGHFDFAAGTTANDLTSWTTVTPSSALLEPGSTADATVRIHVPDHVVGGERYAVIWAQESSSPVVGAAQEINRVGVRVYLDIAGNQQPSDFAITSITGVRAANGSPRVTVRITNTGRRAVDVAGTIGLSDGPGGVQTGLLPTDSTTTLAPGQSADTATSFDPRLLAGPWLVAVNLASGLITHRATATITFTAAPVVVVPVVRHERASLGWVWMVVAAILIAALVVVGLLVRRRRRDSRVASHRRSS